MGHTKVMDNQMITVGCDIYVPERPWLRMTTDHHQQGHHNKKGRKQHSQKQPLYTGLSNR